MFLMSHKISIGGMVLPVLSSVKIRKDVAKLTDTATIVCPAISHGRPLAFVGSVQKWMPVTIDLGYDGELVNEFTGFVRSVAIEGNALKIECEDALLLFHRVDIPNGEMEKPRLGDILRKVVGHVNEYIAEEGLGEPITVDCLYDYGYDKFTFRNTTAYGVMEKIQKEGAPNIYLSGNVLHIVPQFTNTVGRAVYSLQRNVAKDGLKLSWKEEGDRSVYVKVTGVTKDGKKVTAVAGKKGDNKLEVKFGAITDQQSLQKIADNIHRAKTYTGYEGSFKGWLRPFCDAAYEVEIRDETKTMRAGRYYVTAVEVEFSPAGGVRTVSLGSVL